MSTGVEPPNNPPNPALAQEPDRWRAFVRVVGEIAEVGEAPARRVSLDVTDLEHIDRLPSNVLCGLSHGELTELVHKHDVRKGGPDRLEGTLRAESDHRPSKPLLSEFISENGLAGELA